MATTQLKSQFQSGVTGKKPMVFKQVNKIWDIFQQTKALVNGATAKLLKCSNMP